MSEPEDHGLAMPIASLTLVWGLDEEGIPTLASSWTNHRLEDEDVDHLTKAGMVGMIQEEVMAEALGLMPGQEDDDG